MLRFNNVLLKSHRAFSGSKGKKANRWRRGFRNRIPQRENSGGGRPNGRGTDDGFFVNASRL